MIEQARKRIIWLTISMLVAIFALAVVLVFFGVRIRSDNEDYVTLEENMDLLMEKALMQSDNTFSPPWIQEGRVPQEIVDDFRTFYATYINREWRLFYDTSMYDETDIATTVQQILDLNGANGKGRLGSSVYVLKTTEFGTIVAVRDKSTEAGEFTNAILLACAFFGLTVAVLYIFVTFLSLRIMQPLANAFDKQKQFVSDASHELKTPLTIIKANLDVLKSSEQDPSNEKWLNSIQDQTTRMNTLVVDMLSLAKMQETDYGKGKNTQFSLSDTVNSCVMSFEAIAYDKGKKYSYDIAPEIEYLGNPDEIKQLTSILTDNAIKHSDAEGNIEICLARVNKDVVFSISNTGSKISSAQKNKIFERFYRGDFARDRETGGSGLGLAIVKTLADKNKWKINVDCSETDSRITFKVTL